MEQTKFTPTSVFTTLLKPTQIQSICVGLNQDPSSTCLLAIKSAAVVPDQMSGGGSPLCLDSFPLASCWVTAAGRD